jgi:ADP-heptose:LPS heptosyltransferase
MARLNITDRRERALVRAADALLAPAALARRRRGRDAPSRILCLRLERIGDLVMTLPALAELRALAPSAEIDLVVGSWNADLARAIPSVTRIEVVDAAWLSRGADGVSPLALAMRARGWRTRHYDLAINFEPDIRTNLALALAGAASTAGFASGGGGPLLDLALDYDVSAHTADNAVALVRAALGSGHTDPHTRARLAIPEANRQAAAALIARLGAGPLVGIHVSAGRAVKQWPEARFRDVAQHLVRERSASIVFTGSPEDARQIAQAREGLPDAQVLDLSQGTDLLTVAAVLERLDLVVTGDTGPLHLAHAVGTPIVAIFGPSDPRRYAPRGTFDTIVRIDLPCSPCNRIRQPPARCTGHTPDCLTGIDVAQVVAAIDDTLGSRVR